MPMTFAPQERDNARPAPRPDDGHEAWSAAGTQSGQNSAATHPYSENWSEFMGDKTGWILEKDDPPVYHLITDDYDEHWTNDVNKALRFARKEDAEAYMDHIGWTAPPVRTGEHMWVAPRVVRFGPDEGRLHSPAGCEITPEVENYRLALAWISKQSTDPKSRELAATALDAFPSTDGIRHG